MGQNLAEKRVNLQRETTLKRLWAMFGFMCGKRLASGIRINLRVLEKYKELQGLSKPVRERLLTISPATIDRLLEGVDLVAHDGGNSRGDLLHTLTLTDVPTGWTEVRAVRNKAQEWVFPALQAFIARLPLALKGLNADNGGEFINRNLYTWCQLNGVAFTRSRAYRKNDNPFVEQKNNAVVRTTVGYLRYDTLKQQRLMNRLYEPTDMLVNLFSSMKLVQKLRVGARLHKRYDTPRILFQRVLDSALIEEDEKKKLRARFEQLNPAQLTREVAAIQGQLERKALHRQPRPEEQQRLRMAAAG